MKIQWRRSCQRAKLQNNDQSISWPVDHQVPLFDQEWSFLTHSGRRAWKPKSHCLIKDSHFNTFWLAILKTNSPKSNDQNNHFENDQKWSLSIYDRRCWKPSEKPAANGCDVPVRALYCFTTNKLFLDQTNNCIDFPPMHCNGLLWEQENLKNTQIRSFIPLRRCVVGDVQYLYR